MVYSSLSWCGDSSKYCCGIAVGGVVTDGNDHTIYSIPNAVVCNNKPTNIDYPPVDIEGTWIGADSS